MRLAYLAPADIQVARVDRQCIVSFCSALRGIGVYVELVALRIRLMEGELRGADPLSLYRVRKRFRTRLYRVPVSQESPRRWLAFNRLLVHATASVRLALERADEAPLVFYTKTYSSALMLLLLQRVVPSRPVVVFEAHLLPRHLLQRLVTRHSDRVVANTFALEADLVERGYVAKERIIGTHQGVDAELWDDLRVSRAEARKLLGLPEDKKLVVYTGKIYWGYREVEYILDAARALGSRRDVLFLLVGGRADHVSRLRERAEREGLGNVIFTGFVAPNAVHNYQLSADLLTIYYPSGMELNRYRSPGKLFEYMASGRPIVAVDLPVLREVLGEEPAAALVPPDSPELLARKMTEVLDDPPIGDSLGEAALRRVRSFTWDKRARRIAAFIRDGDGVDEGGSEQRGGIERRAA
ncbi:MAG: glycosyltransferase [Actinobacteria bacterium]|nr:glycosyltransferase [Actinomycetota bacterium]